MSSKKSRPFEYYVHIFHRDVGAFLVGYLLFFSLSGMLLVYRKTSFLKHTKHIEKKLAAGLSPKELKKKLKIKKFRVKGRKGDLILFRGGTYNTKTGQAQYKKSKLVFPFDQLTRFHKTSTSSKIHWVIAIFGFLTTLMALSSFWMLKKGHRMYKRNLAIISSGIVFALILMML